MVAPHVAQVRVAADAHLAPVVGPVALTLQLRHLIGGQRAKHAELHAQIVRSAEHYTIHTQLDSSANIGFVIVDEGALPGLQSIAVEQHAEQPLVGLHQPLGTTDHVVFNHLQYAEPLPCLGEGLHAPVGQAVDAHVGVALQLGNHLAHALHLAGQHLLPVRAVDFHSLLIVRILLLFLSDAALLALAGVDAVAPRGVAHMTQEPPRARLVSKVLTVNLFRLPFHQHIAKVEYDILHLSRCLIQYCNAPRVILLLPSRNYNATR